MEDRRYASKQTNTFNNILYLLLSFPLGTIYFVVLVTGLSLGVSTVIIWIGIPILLITIAAIWGMAALERELAVQLLKVNIPLLPPTPAAQKTWRSWFAARIKDPLTWKSFIYLFIKFPLGTVSFCIALTLPIVAFAFLLEPIWYLINSGVFSILNANGVHAGTTWMPFVGSISAQFDPFAFARSFIGVPIGIALWLITRYVLNGMASMSGEFARIMLSPTEYDLARPKDEMRTYQYQEQNQEYWQQARQG